MIDGVKVTPLRQIVDERGKIMHMLRADAEHFDKFGEIYFSCVRPEVIKAWHIHGDDPQLRRPFGHIGLFSLMMRIAPHVVKPMNS